MTKKHFIAVAEILRDTRPDESESYEFWFDIVLRMADYFQNENKLFNRKQFIDACMEKKSNGTTRPTDGNA